MLYASVQTFTPHFIGFAGLYCRNCRRLLNLIIDSSNVNCPSGTKQKFQQDRKTSHLLKALPRQWVALETANLQFLRSRMLTSVSPFFLISLLMVSMYLNFGLRLGLTPSTSMSNTVVVLWLSSLRLTCPYQRSRFCIRCVAIGWTVAASLISLFLLCSLRLTPCIHRNILISVLFISISSFFFIVLHSAPYVIVGFITVL